MIGVGGAVKPYYSSGGIELWEGDCREVVQRLGLGPREVSLVWADPPYGARERTARAAAGRGRNDAVSWEMKSKDWKPIAGDAQPFDPAPWLSYKAVLWGANHYAERLPSSPSWWIWDKTGTGQVVDHNGDAELAWTNLGGAVRVFSFLWKGVAQADKEGRNGVRLHPTMKPEALAEWGFGRAKLRPGDLVLSPYLGSGPEARVARAMGLRLIGVELDPEYLRACVGERMERPVQSPLWPRS